MEIKITNKEISEISEGMEYILSDKCLIHIPELCNLQKIDIPFKKVELKDGATWYVGFFERKKPNISPKLIKHYSRNKPRDYGPTSITIKCNRVIELTGQIFICI